MAWSLTLPDKYSPYIKRQMPDQEPGTTMSPRCIGKGTRFKPHMTMRPLKDGSLACRLYSDDVVIYRPDGRISIDVSYGTQSTTIFASALLPSTIRADSRGGYIKLNGYYWHDDERRGQVRIYNGQELSIEKDENGHWRPIGASEPFHKWMVDRSRAKEICAKHRFADFRKWLQMYLTMSGHITGSRTSVIIGRVRLSEWGTSTFVSFNGVWRISPNGPNLATVSVQLYQAWRLMSVHRLSPSCRNCVNIFIDKKEGIRGSKYHMRRVGKSYRRSGRRNALVIDLANQ
jgi:hypothetical protein